MVKIRIPGKRMRKIIANHPKGQRYLLQMGFSRNRILLKGSRGAKMAIKKEGREDHHLKQVKGVSVQ